MLFCQDEDEVSVPRDGTKSSSEICNICGSVLEVWDGIMPSLPQIRVICGWKSKKPEKFFSGFC
jgi:hypothetical protein